MSEVSVLTVLNRQTDNLRNAYLKEWSADFQGESILQRISTDFLRLLVNVSVENN